MGVFLSSMSFEASAMVGACGKAGKPPPLRAMVDVLGIEPQGYAIYIFERNTHIYIYIYIYIYNT